MTPTTTGWMLLAGALGMMLTLLAVDVTQLANWHEATSTAFVGTTLGHVGAVLVAFAGGKIIPSDVK